MNGGDRKSIQRRRFSAVVLTLLAVSLEAQHANVIPEALSPRSGPRGATMFHLMSPEQTGIVIENNYGDPAMWGARNREFLYGAIGTGVAIGDYDGDGRPDVFVVSKTEGHRLFQNLGDWRFEDVTEKAGVKAPPDHEWEQGASWADVNNDGRLDLYVCRFGKPNLLYINQGDGTFKEEAAARGLAVEDCSVMGSFCDYDRDGWLDVFVVTNAMDYTKSVGRPDRLFHNNGDGTFREVSSTAGIGTAPDQGHAAIWADFDQDGWPDLYVANDFSPPDFLYHNNGDGTFTDRLSASLPHTANSSMGADYGDFNNDGRLDLFVADMEPITHEKDQRTMANVRAISFTAPADPLFALQVPRNALLLNTGTGLFLEAAEMAGLAATDWTWSVRCEDFDGDGRVDVFTTNGMVRELHNVDLRDRVHRAESLSEQVRILKQSPPLPEPVRAFRNQGNLQFENVSTAWGLNQVGISFGAATGDLDGDGDLDLVYVNYQGGVTVLRNDSDHGHEVAMSLRGTASNRFGIGTTVRIETAEGPQVRQLMLAHGYMSSSEPIIHFGLGQADHIDRAVLTWPSGRVQILTNLAADRRYVITEPAATTADDASPAKTNPPQFVEVGKYAGFSFLQKEEPFDESVVQALLSRYFNPRGPAIAVGDLNGDGLDDICLGGTTRSPPRVLFADGNGDYQETQGLSAFGNKTINDGPILIFDADGDDTNDVLVTSAGITALPGDPEYQPRLLLHRGKGVFERASDTALPPFRLPVGAAAAADFDRDGRLDVFLGARELPGQYPVSPRSALLRNRGGKFEDVTDALAPKLREVGLVTSALWTDADDDGWLDLLVATEWGPVRYFHNRQGQGFDDWTEKAGFASAGNGGWTSLAAADFNGDGQPDYMAGNLGLNTSYHASVAQPVLLYRGSFEEEKPPLSIEAYFEGNQIYPRATRNELSALLPSVRKRFPTTNNYAKASLSDILGAERLATAQRWSITQLSSGIFLSQSDHTYRFEPLPRIAQIAPCQGMYTGDIDGDGCADILLVQNDYTFRQAAGRFDGGLGQYLRGDGHGHFAAVPPEECGWVVPGDTRALASADFDRDGWPDFLVSRSKNSSLAWHNRGVPGHRPLTVTLRGSRGNRGAVGARITLELADGTTTTNEVAAGGGVLSQNTAQLFFAYPDNRPPRLIRVRWPDGNRTTREFGEVPERLEIAEP